MKQLKWTAAICSTAILFSSVSMSAFAAPTKMRDISTMDYVREMGLGINLGNTFESCGEWIDKWGDGTPTAYETAWGSPVITEDMIKGYADAGFGTLRVPVAWSNLMGDDYTISDAYLGAVQEVVDWALDYNLHVIVNLHHDGGWLANFPTDKETCMTKYTRIWEQLSDAFQDYGDYLVFESQNEELGWDSLWNRWSSSTDGKAESYALVNEINQKFVDIVRASGGNNAKRHLLISGYGTDIDLTCDPLFQMPQDPANHCAVSVHYYTPSDFAILEEDASWGKVRSTWGTDADIQQLNHYMDMLQTTFVDKGVPVIIGEYGCPKKNKDADSVLLFLSSVCEAAYSRKMCPVMWDITGLHYDRSACQMYDSVLQENFQKILQTHNDTKIGDINQDGSVTIADVILLQQHLLQEKSLTAAQAKAADTWSDGVLNGFDLTALQQTVLTLS